MNFGYLAQEKINGMRFYFYAIFMTILCCACTEDEGQINNENPFLLNPNINITLNLNLPQYNNLTFNGTTHELLGLGNKGIVIYNTNGSQYVAFDMSDPNHIPNRCSKIEINGIEGTCSCRDGNKYNLYTGEKIGGEPGFPLLRYNAFREGNNLTIRN